MTGPRRRNLLEGLSATPRARGVPDEAEIAHIAARHGIAPADPPPAPAPAPPRRQRKPIGRTQQFNVRLHPDTVAEIYAEANGRDIPIAQVIEEAIALLRPKG